MTPSPESAIDRTRHARILVRATNWIGDTVMSMPAVQRLRELVPDAHLALLCPAKLQDLWRHNPFLDEVIPFDDKVNIAHLHAGAFDVAIVFPNSFRSAWECWRAGIPRRIGFAGHRRRRLLTDIAPGPNDETPVRKSITVEGKTFDVKYFPAIRHQVHRYLDLIALLGGNLEPVPPRIWLSPGELPALTKFLHEGSRQFIGINAGAEYGPAKRWIPERFSEAAKRVSDEIACRWLLLGGPGDVEIANTIEAQLRTQVADPRHVVNVAGKTTLMELCELIKFCKLLLTNDTGPMHLAAALGTPVVAIFGSTSPKLTGPLGKQCVVVHQDAECSPCFLRKCPIDFRCMDRITVSHVTDAVLQLWCASVPTHGHV
ncbi:MAG TPA: lipopolysaccharide heptosyltransferase II [Verrucomicrobiae bacterium]|nr:lipopolysaccharide heptosyltransferase II [Verrucomicrobiae bacterium]